MTATAIARWDLPGAVAIELVLVPAGPFVVGSEADDPDAWPDECPPRVESLPAFWISRHAVTWRQYLAYARARAVPLPPAPTWGIREDHPVVNVTHDDARGFAAWAGLDLPTELEWEKAGRGGDRRRFPWGDAPVPGNALWRDHPVYGNLSTGPAGRVGADLSPYGVADVAGNVREWCADAIGSRVAVRGGSWRGDAASGRIAFRGRLAPGCRNPDLDFRVVGRGAVGERFA